MRFETSAVPARPWRRARGMTHPFAVAAVLSLQLARAPDARAQTRYPDPNDVRIDVQAIFTFARELPTTERVTSALIWHPPARRRASPGGHR